MKTIHKLDTEDFDMFWKKILKPVDSECWLWSGSKQDGYGMLYLPAHRLSYILHKGPIPPGKVIMHSCDNPPCVNPDHLSLGDQADNVADRHRKGRTYRRLNAERVNEIRRLYSTGMTMQKIAAALKTSHATISRVVNSVCDSYGANTFPATELFIAKQGRPAAKLTLSQVAEIRSLYATGGYSQRKLAGMFGITHGAVSFIVNHKTFHDT